MKVLFVHFDGNQGLTIAAIGPAYLAAWLRRAGHEAELVRADETTTPDELLATIEAASPGLVGVSATTLQWQICAPILAELEGRLGVPLIVGGLQATFAPQETWQCPTVDYLCLGEGEEALLELVEALSAGTPTDDILNIWTRGGKRARMRPPLEPIDDVPFMARDILDEQANFAHMATQRGCPFVCTYCAARMYNAKYKSEGYNYGRRRSPENVLAEIEAVRAERELDYIAFMDDTFTVNRTWVRAFCKMYKERVGVPFWIQTRMETVTPEILAELAAAGCAQITYGIESGSYRVRKEILKRPIEDATIHKVLRWTIDAGIFCTANFVLGFPGETVAEMEETLKFIEDCEVQTIGWAIFYPFPGTDLLDVCKAEGLLRPDFDSIPADLKTYSLIHPELSEEEFTAFRTRLEGMLDVKARALATS